MGVFSAKQDTREIAAAMLLDLEDSIRRDAKIGAPARVVINGVEYVPRITLWMYVTKRGRVAITPDPDELPGGEQWFTRWHATRASAIAEAREWLEARGLTAGKIVGG